MPQRLPVTTPRQAGLIAGLGYLAIFVLAVFANFFVRERLVDPADATATFANIAASDLLFRSGIVSFLIVFVLDVVVAWALYVLFRSVSWDRSLLAAWFRLVYTVFLGVALVFMLGVAHLAAGAEYLSAFDAGQVQAHAMLLLEAFDYAWLIGLVCFGLHLVLIANLLWVSGWAPKLLSILLAAAGVAYVLDTVARALLANYADYATLFLMIVALPSVIGELWLGLWLLLRGGSGVPTDRPEAAAA